MFTVVCTDAQTVNPADTGCIRKTPDSTLVGKNPNIVGYSFHRTGKRAMEKARLFIGDSLYIEHTGCKDYRLIYTVKSKRFDGDPANAGYWFARASDLLIGIQNSDVPFDYEWGWYFLDSIAKSGKAKLNTPYILDQDNGTVQTLNITKTGKLQKGGFFVMEAILAVKPPAPPKAQPGKKAAPAKAPPAKSPPAKGTIKKTPPAKPKAPVKK